MYDVTVMSWTKDFVNKTSLWCHCWTGVSLRFFKGNIDTREQIAIQRLYWNMQHHGCNTHPWNTKMHNSHFFRFLVLIYTCKNSRVINELPNNNKSTTESMPIILQFNSMYIIKIVTKFHRKKRNSL